MLPGTNQNPCQDMFACIVGILYKLMCPYIRAMPTVSFALLLLLLAAFALAFICFASASAFCFCVVLLFFLLLLLRPALVFAASATARGGFVYCCAACRGQGLPSVCCCKRPASNTTLVAVDPVLLQAASFQRCPQSLEEEGASPTVQTKDVLFSTFRIFSPSLSGEPFLLPPFVTVSLSPSAGFAASSPDHSAAPCKALPEKISLKKLEKNP